MKDHEFKRYDYNWIDKEKHPVGSTRLWTLENVARHVLVRMFKHNIDAKFYVKLTNGCASIEKPGSYKFTQYTKKSEPNDKWELESLLNNKKIIDDVKKWVNMDIPEYGLEFNGDECIKTRIN